MHGLDSGVEKDKGIVGSACKATKGNERKFTNTLVRFYDFSRACEGLQVRNLVSMRFRTPVILPYSYSVPRPNCTSRLIASAS